MTHLRAAHRTVGHWSLGQICDHLARGIDGAIDGLDLSRHRVKRGLFRKILLACTLRFGIPENYMVDPGIEPTEPVSDEQGIGRLAAAVERYIAHDGPLQAHPLFGKMSREQWDRMHCVHCAHHLSFVVPDSPNSAQ